MPVLTITRHNRVGVNKVRDTAPGSCAVPGTERHDDVTTGPEPSALLATTLNR